MNDKKLVRWLLVLILFPAALVYCSGDRFRYPCQDPHNWDKEICQMPLCEVNRTCPEHIFKGQRDPRLGPQNEQTKAPAATVSQGVNCGK